MLSKELTFADSVEGVSSQANSIVSHPTMPLLITGHEDKHIRIFDILTGELFSSCALRIDAEC